MDDTTSKTQVTIPRFIDGTDMSIDDLAHCLHIMDRMQHRRIRDPEPADLYKAWVFAHMEIKDKLPPIPSADDDTDMGLNKGTFLAGAMALINDDLACETLNGDVALIVHQTFEVH